MNRVSRIAASLVILTMLAACSGSPTAPTSVKCDSRTGQCINPDFVNPHVDFVNPHVDFVNPHA